MKRLLGLALLSGLVFGISSNVSAQSGQTQTGNDQMRTDKREHQQDGNEMHRGKRGGMMKMRGLNKLNLTDQQKEQIRTIIETNRTANEPIHQEMMTLREAKRSGTLTAEQTTRMETLKTQMKQNHDQIESQILAVLTSEQRQKYDQMQEETRQNRKEKHDRWKNGENKEQTKPQN